MAQVEQHSHEHLQRLVASGPRNAPAREQLLAVASPLLELFPHGGLTRGQTVGCRGTASLSLAMSVAAQATVSGSWLAVAGLPTMGLQAAAEAGIALERVMMATIPVGITEAAWANAVSALIDGFDLIVLRQSSLCPIRAATARRLQARLQSRGAVLIVVGQPGDFSIDVALSTSAGQWAGLGRGYGRLMQRRVEVSATGRRVAQIRRTELWLPNAQGSAESLPATQTATSTPPAPQVAPLRQTG